MYFYLMEMEDDIKSIIVCLINHKPLYIMQVYPLAIGHLDYDIFKQAWSEKFKDERSESQFFKELEKWGIYHSPSENLIVLKPEDMQLKRKIINVFYNFKNMFKKKDKVSIYLNDIQKKENRDLFKKALIFLLRDKEVYLNHSELSFLKTSEEELKDILSRFVAKYGLAICKNRERYKLLSFISQYDINNFLCPYFGLDLIQFIEDLPKKEADAFNVIFGDQRKCGELRNKVRSIGKKKTKIADERGLDTKEVKELDAEVNVIYKEISEIEEKLREKLGRSVKQSFFTDSDKIAKILKIPEERCYDVILNLKMKGLFSTPNYSSQGLDWVEISQNIINN